jgi:hypothetical protein
LLKAQRDLYKIILGEKMKKLITFLITFCFLLSVQIISQTYLVVSYNNGATANSTDLTSITKITFSSTDINFLLTDNSTVSKAFTIVNKIAFSGTDGGSPLPVELVSFTAAVNGDRVTLQWSTATEVNNYGFEIERDNRQKSIGNNAWQKIGFVQGYGNSNSPKEYSFTDLPNGGTHFNYRLKQIDTDGKYQYSKIEEVEFGVPIEYELKQNFPNPFNPQTKIAYHLPVDGFVTLKVFDALGREAVSLVNENKKAGSYEVELDGSRLASGVYICKMSSANYSSVIKMLMLK